MLIKKSELIWLLKFLVFVMLLMTFASAGLRYMDDKDSNDKIDLGQLDNLSKGVLEEIPSSPNEEKVRSSQASSMVTTKLTLEAPEKEEFREIKDVNQSNAYDLIDLASQGDLDAGIEFLAKFAKCKDYDEMKSRAESLGNLMEQISDESGVPIPPSLSKMSWNNVAADNVYECIYFLGGNDGVFKDVNRQITERLKSEADNGRTMARFLYSMWGPSDTKSIHFSADISEYERIAREYTLLNLQEDAGLALLALGISYSGGKYFTPMRLPLGRSYLWAAALCGINQSVTDQFLNQYAGVSWANKFSGEVIVNEELVKETALTIATETCLNLS